MSKNQTGKKPISGRKRTLSRLMAIQIFYQFDFFNREKNLEEILREVVENYLLDTKKDPTSFRSKIDENFLNDLVFGVASDVTKIDLEITNFLKAGHRLENLDDVLKQLLRMGTFELKFLQEIPFKVIINEYVNIASCFFPTPKIPFVNATLNNLAKKFRNV